MTHLKSLCNFAMSMLFRFLPIKQNRFYFNSFHGQYSDSPKKISEELHKIYPKAEYYWEFTNKSHEVWPHYIRTVNPHTIRALYLKYTSRLLVDNYFGAHSGFAVAGTLKYKLLSLLLRKGQLIIGTWHGTSLKKIATDEPGKVNKNLLFYTKTDYLTCESEHMRNVLQRITCGKIPILMIGYPRNDILFNVSEKEKNKLRKKLKLPDEKKIILYAPTFRTDNKEMSGQFQIQNLDIEKLLTTCSEKFGGKWIFVYRVHDSVIEGMKECTVHNNFVLSGNIGDDMAEYLAVTDVLITDYSSSMFDFMLTKRPCFLYCPDLDYYMNVERGFYFCLQELPFMIASTADELYETIMRFVNTEYLQKTELFLTQIGHIDDGNATEKIVAIIKRDLEI